MKLSTFFHFAATIFLSATFSQSAVAMSPKNVDFSNLNLVGLQIMNGDGMDTLRYDFRIVPTPSKALVSTLEAESNSTIVSPLFELNEPSSFENIYLYVAKTEEGNFELVEALHNKSGSFFIIDMDIQDITKTEMILMHGPSDDVELLKASLRSGNLLP